jgi:flagellar assembly protein FliH
LALTQGRVLRASELSAMPARLVEAALRPRREPALVVAAQERADALLERAERQARELVEAARREASAVKLAAELEGRALGIAEAARALLRLRKLEQRIEERSLGRIVELSRLLAERLLCEELSQRPEVVLGRAREVLQAARGESEVELAVNAQDLPLLEAELEAMGVNTGTEVRFVVAPELERGELRMSTRLGVVEARFGAELSRLTEALREHLAQG